MNFLSYHRSVLSRYVVLALNNCSVVIVHEPGLFTIYYSSDDYDDGAPVVINNYTNLTQNEL